MAGDSDVTPATDLEQKIIRQMEYYFGDINLRKDKFLQAQVKQEEGWVPLETMVKFNRLKSMTTDFEVIVGAIKKSTNGLLEVGEDGKKIRRCPSRPLPEYNQETRLDMKTRSLYVKGFPVESSLDQLQVFFEKFGEVDYVHLRKNEEKEFKGSVFVIYKTKDLAEKFLADDATKYGDSEEALIKMFREDYFKKKNEEKKNFQEDRLQKREEKKKERDEKNFEDKITKGAILHLKGFSDKTVRDAIKEKFNTVGTVAWVDFNTGDKEAWLRFGEEGMAKTAWAKAKEAKFSFGDEELEGDVLEGEAEINHWRNIFNQRREQADRKFNRGRPFKRHAGHSGGKPFKRGRSNQHKTFDDDSAKDADAKGGDAAAAEPAKTKEDTSAEPAEKKAKVEDASAEPAEKKAKVEDASAEPAEKKAKADNTSPAKSVKPAAENSADDGPPAKKEKIGDA